MKRKKDKRSAMNQKLLRILHEIEVYLLDLQEYLEISITDMLQTVSLIRCEYQFSKYAIIKHRINLIGLLYVQAGIIYS